MKRIRGKFNDKFVLDNPGDDFPINIHVAGSTRPSHDFNLNVVDGNPTTLNYYQFEFITSGRGYVEVNGEKYTVEAGDFFFINKAYLRTILTDRNDPFEKIFVTVKGTFIDALISGYGITAPIIVAKLDVKQYLMQILKILEDAEEYNTAVKNAISIELLKIVQVIHTDYITASKPQFSAVSAEDIMRYIDLNLSNKFTIEDIANNFYICVTQVIRLFKNRYKITPMKYTQMKRIEMAKYYLTETNIPVSALHDLIGFSDVKYFSKLFKQITGQPPREYRNENQNKK